MRQTTFSPLSPARTSNWRAGLNVLLGFIVLYAAIWVVRVIMGVGPNMLMKWLGATPDFRAYVGSTLNYGVGILSYIVLPMLALRKMLGIDPRPIFLPLRKDWWQDLLFGFMLITVVLSVFFVLEVQAGWLVVESWTWQTMSWEAWLRIAWVGLLVNVGVAIGEETVFRGYLLTGLKTAWGKWTVPALMIHCLVAPFVAQKTRNTYPGIVSHLIVNGLGMGITIIQLLIQ